EYERLEMVIQQLGSETGPLDPGDGPVSVDADGAEAPADWASLRSPENYTGYERTEGFASPGGVVPGRPHTYTAPADMGLNRWAVSGGWTMEAGAAPPNEADGRVVHRLHPRQPHLVMGPRAPGSRVRFRVRLHGRPPGAAHGVDVDDEGNGTVSDQRLYQLIRQPGHVADSDFEITFLDPGVQAFSFTFG